MEIKGSISSEGSVNIVNPQDLSESSLVYLFFPFLLFREFSLFSLWTTIAKNYCKEMRVRR